MDTRNCKSFYRVFVTVILLISVFAQAEFIYVSCQDGTIQKFDLNGNGSVFASGLDSPHGLAFDTSGNLYVVNDVESDTLEEHAATIEMFNPSGGRSTFAAINYSNLSWWQPLGLAFRNGDLYALISRDDPTAVLKFDSSGNSSLFSEGVGGIGGIDLAFDSSGNLYMSNIEGQIFKFDSIGNETLVASVSSLWALGIDSSDNLYATIDATIGTILKFDSSGGYTIFASGQFRPYDIAFDGAGNLYMTDYYNGTILIFDPSGESAVFASGLNGPGFIMIIPEPASACLVLIGLGMIRFRNKKLKK
ncbi:MAG: hypothetical protein ABFD79_17275 [Phycisphaerales bacterium]